MTLQEHYHAIKSGKGNKGQFLKQARNLFPEYFNQYTDFDTATNVLKSKQIISEAAGGVVAKGFDIWDWKKILAEEVKAEEKETSKEVLDDQKNAYNNSDMKNADNVNFNEIMKGFYAEMRDEKNAGKTGDEIKAMVVKNLAKDPLFYTKDGMFGEKGVGYTDEAPALGVPKEPKGKYKSSGYGDLDVDIKIEKVKSNVQDSLGDQEAETSMPKKVKEMPDKGVTGVEKKMKLKESIEVDKVDEDYNSNEALNEASIGSEELQTFSRDIYAKDDKIYISPKLAQSLQSSYFNRGPSSYERTKSDPDQTRSVYLNIESGFRSMLRKGLKDALVTSLPGVKNSELPSKTTPALQYKWIKLNFPEKDYEVKIGDNKITINKKSKEAIDEAEQKLRSIIREIIKESLEAETNLNEISPELFKRATDVSRERGQDRRTSSMGETFFNKFKGKPLMGSTIADVSYAKPQSGDYEEVIVRIEVPSSVVPGETKSRYIYYDVRKDQWGVDKEITRADARILSLIAQHINPNTRYKSGGEGFQIKGYQ